MNTMVTIVTHLRSHDVSTSSPNNTGILETNLQSWLLLATTSQSEESLLNNILRSHDLKMLKDINILTFPAAHLLLVLVVLFGNHGYQNDAKYWLLEYSIIIIIMLL